MTRRFRRSSPKPPPRPPKDLKAADMRRKGKPPLIQESNPIPEDLESGIIRNWNLSTRDISTCVPPELWPRNEPDPKKWHIDVIHLLHEASTIKWKENGKVSCSNNEWFCSSMKHEIRSRQLRNKSAEGKAAWMTATDLKKVIKKLHFMARDEEDARAKGEEWREVKEDQKPSVRRGRSGANNTTATQDKPDEANGTDFTQQETTKAAPRGRDRLKRNEPNGRETVRPGTKRQASDLPIRPARKLRGVKLPKTKPKPAAPPPVTPANPLENSDEEEEEDRENEPPEPVSGRHIYGDFIKPTTVDFNAENEAPAQARTRQTRKRGRADHDKPPTEVQIDSDPRDIDATGFLSELDPKEARRRRKPRLSRLQQDPVWEPAWSQDVPAPPETPLLAPATDVPVSGTPAAPQAAGLAAVSSPPAQPMTHSKDAAIKLLLELLPMIPEHATPDERSMLEDRASMIHRDIITYKTAVWEINERMQG
ncbi:hypothetical protein BU25DRAFT_17350 [Macroventuria anomochaeta]|uniref:Uncharacterized protein n=1 Tax=Macroventuria anomochaeta TaxID=301207 RepID=A0ACB6SIV5_9PLEO|nr:uncharacterized protein BU25DRAFT_17350 [Macroventuria anomochaeta]KAF2633978.1 hypothetical protein BU25DRAFT_17350 [Macroventuria anomochaeta]